MTQQNTKEHFTPPYPIPHKTKHSLLKRFFTGQISWLHTLFEKSYTMKMGEIKLPKLDFFIVNETSLVKRILVDEMKKFPKHQLLEELLEPLLGRGILAVSGTEWETQRKMVYPAFTHANLRRTFDMMYQASEDIITKINHLIDQNKPVSIDPLMTFVTADIIYRTLFSMKLNEADSKTIYKAFNRFQSAVQPCALLKLYGLPTLYHRWKIKKATAQIHNIITPIIQQRYEQYHQQGIAGEDILGALLEAKDPETDNHFTLQGLVDQVSSIFLAGHETSASTLTWALYLLAETPEIQQECREQIPTDGFDHTDLKKLTKLSNVFDETLRLYPPISFLLREATCPLTIRKKEIPEKAMIAMSPWLIQRNPNEWQCPHQFNPDRFDDDATSEARKHAYLPFGKGPRTCVGAAFAKQESLIIMANILKHFTLSYDKPKKPKPISRVTLRPHKDICLTVKRTPLST